MKKIILTSIFSAALLTVVVVSSSFTTTEKTASSKNVRGNIDFKVENNTGGEFKYCVNGGHNYINSGQSKSFSYSVGQDFYYVENGSCGKQWFEVKADMAGKTFKVTDL